MNRIKLLRELDGKFSDFKIHPKLINDIMGVISASGNEINFLKKLTRRLQFLKANKEKSHIMNSNEFEKLTNEKNLYSMHIQDRTFNMRILYTFEIDGTILLYGFHEEEDKNATDYFSAIPVARKRYIELTEEYNE